MWKKPSFFWVNQIFWTDNLNIGSCKQEIRNCHFLRETGNKKKQFKETKTMISNSYFIRQSFKAYRGKLNIVI